MSTELCFIFDVDDTLYDQLDPFRLAYEKNFTHAKKQVSVEELYKKSRYYSDQVFAKTESGEMDIWDMRIYRMKNAFKSLGVSISDSQALAFEQDYAYFLQHIQLQPAMRDVLKLCKEQNVKLGIITNGQYERQFAKIQKLGVEKWIPKENWFISGKVKLMKPDPRLFHYAEAKMNISPKNTYYVGDSFNNDVIGAKKAGWHMIWLNRRSSLSAGTIQPEITITDIDTLLSCIKIIIKKQNERKS